MGMTMEKNVLKAITVIDATDRVPFLTIIFTVKMYSVLVTLVREGMMVPVMKKIGDLMFASRVILDIICKNMMKLSQPRSLTTSGVENSKDRECIMIYTVSSVS